MNGDVRHLFICTNTVASGKPACGRAAILAAVQQRLLERGGRALVTGCACLGPCFDGPNAVVYPDGTWYGGLTEEDADRLVDHLIDGTIFAEKLVSRGE